MPPSKASPVSSAAAASSARSDDKEVSPVAHSAPVSVSASTRQDPLEETDPEPEPLDQSRMLSRSMLKSTKASSSTSSVSAQSVASPAASSASAGTSSSVGFDRDLFGKLEDVTSELDRLTRISTALPETRELEVVQAQLKRAQRHSSAMVQSQRELLDKIDRHERSSFRRYFQFNREHKVESLKETLWKRMNESATVERELEQLERKSDTLIEARRHTIADSDLSSSRLGFGSSRLGFGSSRLGFSSSRGFASSRSLGSSRGFDMSTGPPSSPSAALSEAAQVALRIDELERERQSIVGTLLQTLPVPETQQLGTRIAMYVSEIRASESIQQQVERCAAMYRDALRNLQNALAILLAPTYAGTLKEFVTGPYLMAVEASHQIEAASHVLQPEAQRRYRTYAPDLINVRPPKFPQAITDFAKRARVNYDRKSSLSVEGTRKLHAAENIIVLLHRIVIQKLELINQWLSEVEQDVARATEAHRRADARLREQMAVVARSASA